MRAEITQQNLFLILAGKAAAVAAFIVEDEHISPLEALTKFYVSDTYRRLEREDTKYWHLGPVALYQDYAGINGFLGAERTQSRARAM